MGPKNRLIAHLAQCQSRFKAHPSRNAIGVALRQEFAEREWAGRPGIGAQTRGQLTFGIAHGRPPDPADLYPLGSIDSEEAFIGPKVLVYTCQMWMPALDESARTIDPRPDPGIIHIELVIHLKCQLYSRWSKNLSY